MNLKAAILRLLARKSHGNEFRPETFRRILIVRPEKIGDTICMLPMIRELKNAFPGAQIDVYASTYNNFMFRYMPEVNNVYTKYRKKNALGTLRSILRMRSNHYDLAIDTIDLRFGKILALTTINPDWLIGTSEHTNRYGIGPADLKLYYKLVPWKNIHMTDMLLEFLGPLGIHDVDGRMFFPVGDEAAENAKAFIAPYKNRTLVGLNADATSAERSLLNDEICSICRKLAAAAPYITIVLFSSPDRRQYMQNLVQNENLENVVCEAGTRNIFDASALAGLMRVIISPDTSFIHIASAFNVPTVAIFQNDPVHLKYWAPRSDHHIVIQPEQPGSTIRGFSIDETVSAAIDLLTADSLLDHP
jgi:ADP-heptose:LPS heptosyltransferase